jgi:hypothetical protein
MRNDTNSLYYYSENNEVLGPFTIQELEGKINPDSLVFNDTGTKWVKASDVPEISDLLFVNKLEIKIEGKAYEISDREDSNPYQYDDKTNSNNLYQYNLEVKSNRRSNSLKTILIIFILIGVIGGGVYIFLNSDYYKWRNADKMYCYIPVLNIRSDITTFSDNNIVYELKFGDSVLVLNNPKLTPWIDVKLGDIEGVVHGNYLTASNNYIIILSSLLNDKSKQDDISELRWRKSLVDHILRETSLTNFQTEKWRIIKNDDNNYISIDGPKKGKEPNSARFLLEHDDYIESIQFNYDENGNEISTNSKRKIYW